MGYRILVIDDDDTHLLATHGILTADGHEVSTHRGPFGATGRLLRETPDLVLLDVNMPALSGEHLARLIGARGDWRGAVLLHSSNDAAALREAASRLALDGYVCKGDPDALRAAVKKHGQQGRSRRLAADGAASADADVPPRA